MYTTTIPIGIFKNKSIIRINKKRVTCWENKLNKKGKWWILWK
ncbi:MAG: hypothetical protein RHS_1403 [Robinsoniella sp. RHS]|nr:MAG: hypothetical protein RHS_1403 [Robinsoniella sp. RHS]